MEAIIGAIIGAILGIGTVSLKGESAIIGGGAAIIAAIILGAATIIAAFIATTSVFLGLSSKSGDEPNRVPRDESEAVNKKTDDCEDSTAEAEANGADASESGDSTDSDTESEKRSD